MNKYKIFISGIQMEITIWADKMLTKENGQTFLYKNTKINEYYREDAVIAVIPKEAFIQVTMIDNKPVI